MTATYVIKQAGRGAFLIAASGGVLGFIAGHAMGSRLSQGLLKTAIETSVNSALLGAASQTVTMLAIQAATAIACAAIVPAVVVIVLLRNERNNHEAVDKHYQQRTLDPDPGRGSIGRLGPDVSRHPRCIDIADCGAGHSVRTGVPVRTPRALAHPDNNHNRKRKVNHANYRQSK